MPHPTEDGPADDAAPPDAAVPDPDAPIRLDKLVARRFGLSRSSAMEAIRTGRIDLAGERCDEPGRMVEPNAELKYAPHRPKARRVEGSNVRVLHEDRHLIVVNKPPGLLTLPTARHEPDSLIERVRRYLAIRHGRPKPYVGVIHRLDRETSGVVALARSPEALRAFQNVWKAHDLERTYLAVVEGVPGREQGRIDVPMAPNEEGVVRRRVAHPEENSREAVTHWRLVERFGVVASLLSCRLETGRTHQIRVHLTWLGHPVVGDPIYRPPERPRSKAQFARQALHAQTLGLIHPLTGREVRVEAPVADDLSALILDLRNRYGLPNAGG